MNPFIKTIQLRRTQYALGKQLPIDQAEVVKLIQDAVKLSPSSFNSQSSRVIILFGHESDKLWDIVKNELRSYITDKDFTHTEIKINHFAAGAGTILFFEDQDTITHLQQTYPLYADNFPVWSEQASGMAQFSVWTALANAHIGASLQHYNPLIDQKVASEWNVPTSWRLRAEMPFGSHEAEFKEKTFIDDRDRFKIFG